MNSQRKTLDEIKKDIDASLIDITKCYILIKYAFNTAEEDNLYKEEFKKRYINFYKKIIDLEEDINNRYMEGINDSIKRILNIDFYKPKFNFLDSKDIDIQEINTIVESDYERKAAQSAVKMNFYHNNLTEFGRNTRFHVNTTKYGVIDPKTHDEEENIYIFSQLTDYFIKNYSNGMNKTKKYTKDM